MYDIYRNINEAYVEASINIYDSQKTKSSMALPPYRGCATRTIVRAHYQCYYSVHYLNKLYHQYFFKIMGGSLIVNLILLG